MVRAIAERKQHIVYMLWGSYAQRKAPSPIPGRILILKAVHPSPLSVYRGFFGCRHFSRANEYLRSVGKGADRVVTSWNKNPGLARCEAGIFTDCGTPIPDRISATSTATSGGGGGWPSP